MTRARLARGLFGAGVFGAGLAIAAGGATAQTVAPLIEREPPIATRPVAPAPILVPNPGGVPVPVAPPMAAPAIVVPPGPPPVVVPPAPKPTLDLTPQVPSAGAASHPAPSPKAPEAVKPAEPTPAAEKPADAPAAPSAPVEAPKPADAAVPPAQASPVSPAAPATPVAPSADQTPVAPGPSAPPAAAQPAPSASPAAEAAPLPAPAPAPVAPPPVEKPSFEEVTVEARPVLYVTGKTTWDDAEETMAKAFATLAQAQRKLGIGAGGSPLVQYIETDSDDVGYMAMLPIVAEPTAKLPKGVKVGRSPAGKALKFHHSGPLDDLEEVYARIDDVLQQKGLEAKSIVEQYDADALASPEDRVVLEIFVFLK